MAYTLSFHFANSEEQKLDFLTQEDDGIYRWLSPNNGKAYTIDRVSATKGSNISDTVTNHRDSLWLFHYSGHADGQHLFIEDEALRGEGIGHQLTQCPNLTLVMLNGCATRGQVQYLLDNGVKAVVATSAPVGDRSASDFALRFYEALSKRATISEAFEIAVGEVQQRRDLGMRRGLVLDEDELEEGQHFEAGDGLWGLFFLSEKDEVLQERLPEIAPKPINFDEEPFMPNDYFLESLWDAFKDHHHEIQILDQRGDNLEYSAKVTALYNYLAAPLAEYLRRLLVPSGPIGEGEVLRGYDQISYDRLVMLIRTYRVALDLVAFTILTQLWEAKQRVPGFSFTGSIKEAINHYMSLSKEDRESYRYPPLLKQAEAFLLSIDEKVFTQTSAEKDSPETQEILTYFRKILRQTQDFLGDKDFYDAAIYLEIYRERLKQETTPQADWKREELFILCERAEYHLSKILEKLGIFLKYTMATSKAIEVRKDRSIEQARFNHTLVRLTHITGGYGEVEMTLEDSPLDSKSVVLMEQFTAKPAQENLSSDAFRFLSFSPFILDRNAFDEKGQLAMIYFFHHYDAEKESYLFYHLRNPVKDQMLEVKKPVKAKPRKGPVRPGRKMAVTRDPYQPVWEQFESFRKIFA